MTKSACSKCGQTYHSPCWVCGNPIHPYPGFRYIPGATYINLCSMACEEVYEKVRYGSAFQKRLDSSKGNAMRLYGDGSYRAVILCSFLRWLGLR